MHSTVSLLRVIAMAGVVAPVPLTLLAAGDDETDWNHFGLNYRMGFNLQAKFSAHSSIPAAPSAGSAVNRGYDDGFVNVDSSGNAGGQTWNWGYQNSSQVSGDTLQMHATTYPTGSQEKTDDPQMGVQISYIRDWDHEDWGRWGIKFAFGYTDICLHDNGNLNGSLITDTYQLNGVTPPLAPYTGSFGGPGPVIGSAPTRALSAATITGSRNLDASLYDFHVGPAFDFDLTKRFSIELGGGLALGIVDSTFSFSETTTSALGSSFASGSTSDAGLQGGFYLEGGVAYRLTDSVSLYGGTEFEYLDTFTQSIGGHDAQIDLSQSVFFVLGLEFHF